MVTAAQISQISWIASCVLQIAWMGRLAHLKLIREYPVLFSYLAAATLLSVTAFVFRLFLPPWDSPGARPFYEFYGWFWVVSQPLVWTFSFCVIVEVYNRILEDFKGLQRLGQLAMYGALGGVGCLFLAMLFLDTSAETWRRFWMVQERGVYTGLTVLSVLLLSFAWFFKLRIPKNVRVIFGVFGLVFAAQAGFVVLLLELGGGLEQLKGLIVPVVGVVTMLAGTVLFSARGEQEAQPRPTLDRETESMATEGLQGFNDVLLKVLRS